MPFRKGEKEPFDPSRHVKDKGDESFVRKSAIENDREAEREAELRNQEKSWFKKLFGKRTDIKGIDIAHEEATAEYVKGLTLYISSQKTVGIEGQFHGVQVRVYKYEGCSEVGGEQLTQEEGAFVFKKLFPFVKQSLDDKAANVERKSRRFTEKGQKAIDKLFKARPQKELREANTPPQLPSESDSFPEKKEDNEEKPE